jgi:hypothetical protein
MTSIESQEMDENNVNVPHKMVTFWEESLEGTGGVLVLELVLKKCWYTLVKYQWKINEWKLITNVGHQI